MNGQNGQGALFPSLLSLMGYGLKVSNKQALVFMTRARFAFLF